MPKSLALQNPDPSFRTSRSPRSLRRLLPSLLAAACAALIAAPGVAADRSQDDDSAARRPTSAQLAAHPPAEGHRLDTSGRPQVGEASFYASQFNGRKMADGQPMNPQDDNAASKTLPLGTKARVTNLETGKSAVVTIQDRGPYVDGRIVDLSPASAQQIGLTKQQGVTDVKVEPIAVPLPDGSVKPGAGATPAQRRAIEAEAAHDDGPSATASPNQRARKSPGR